jgi:hypothetical protein
VKAIAIWVPRFMSCSVNSSTPDFPDGDPHPLHTSGGDEANNLTSADYEDGSNMLETNTYMQAEAIEDRMEIDPNIFANTSDLPHDRAATLEEIALAIESDLDRTNVDDLQVVTNARQPLNRLSQDRSPQRLQEIAAVKVTIAKPSRIVNRYSFREYISLRL